VNELPPVQRHEAEVQPDRRAVFGACAWVLVDELLEATPGPPAPGVPP